MKNPTLTTRGFTLVEMIVAIGIFIVVAVVAVGALLKTIDANQKSQSLKTAITNMNFALESMSREMRVGTTYTCGAGSFPVLTTLTTPTACATPLSGTWYIAFNSSKRAVNGTGFCNLIYAYYFDGSSLKKAQQPNCATAISDADLYPVISSNAGQDVVLDFDLGTIKVVAGGGVQPYAQLRFKGTAGGAEKTKSVFDIQTTISQRLRE